MEKAKIEQPRRSFTAAANKLTGMALKLHRAVADSNFTMTDYAVKRVNVRKSKKKYSASRTGHYEFNP